MPFGHKLAHRLALLKGRLRRGALLALALSFVASCEKPASISGPNSTVTELVVSPSSATLQPNQVQDFTAVGFRSGFGQAHGGDLVYDPRARGARFELLIPQERNGISKSV